MVDARGADLAARVLLTGPDNAEAAGLTGLVVGGDKESIGAVLEDRRLAPLLTLPRRTFLDIDGVFQPAPAPRYSGTPTVRPDPPRREGEDGAAILAELGYDEAAIADLLEDRR